MSRPNLSRRTLLRGIGGATLALPMLEAMFDSGTAHAAATIPKRYVVSFGGHSLGSDNGSGLTTYWVPSVVGANYNLPDALLPIAPVKQHVSVVSGLKIPCAYDNGGVVPPGGKVNNFHAYMLSPLLSGMRSANVGSTWAQGPTSDQVAADALGAGSVFKSIYACVQASTYMQGDSFQPISFRSANVPNQAQLSPRALFQSLFGNFTGTDPAVIAKANRERTTRLLIIDRVKESAARLSGQLGMADRRRMDQHLDEVRDLERRVLAIPPVANNVCQKPADPGSDPTVGGSNAVVNGSATYNPNLGYSDEEARASVMADLFYMAIVCDLTRSICWQITHPQCFLNMKTITGFAADMHSMSHNLYDPYHAKAVAWHIKHWCRLVDRLSKAPEGNGSALDNTALTYVSEGGRGFSPESNTPNSTHSTENMLALIAGHAGGLKGGVHIAAGNQSHPAQVLFTALKAVGYTGSKLGEVGGEIAGLRA